MGGNLFNLGRKPRKQYLEIESKVRNYLDKTIGSENYRIPRYYDSKETFGDLDILVNDKYRFNNHPFPDEFAKDLNSVFTKRSGAVISNNIDDFQVDLFFFHKDYLQIASDFMDYNIGNFIGKIAKRLNLKYGDHGLYYVFRRENSDHYKAEYKLSSNIEEILPFFGFDYNRWKEGFKTPIESYEWIISTPYFSTYTYFKPTANNKKRIEFENFMLWLKDNNVQKDWNSSLLTPEDKLKLVYSYFFPEIGLFKFIENEKIKEITADIVSKKYNGNIVMELTNLKGKELGIFMNSFKNYIEQEYNDNFNSIICKLSEQEIISHIKAKQWEQSINFE